MISLSQLLTCAASFVSNVPLANPSPYWGKTDPRRVAFQCSKGFKNACLVPSQFLAKTAASILKADGTAAKSRSLVWVWGQDGRNITTGLDSFFPNFSSHAKKRPLSYFILREPENFFEISLGWASWLFLLEVLEGAWSGGSVCYNLQYVQEIRSPGSSNKEQ